MRTIGDLKLLTDFVAPYATVSSAIRELRAHGCRALSVLQNGEFLGIINLDLLKNVAPDLPVREVMSPVPMQMQAETPIRSVSKLLGENDIDIVPVYRNDRFLGLLTSTMLIVELGRSWDPMTGLSWSDRLRDWGIEALQSGQEITLLFIDLNDFGRYNKAHGHIIGDLVIKSVAKLLSESIDANFDILVRYAGDEFAIGSRRPRAELEVLALELSQAKVNIEGIPDPVGFTIGFAGGKRTQERDRTHYASTVDNLINLASQDSLRQKPPKSKTPGTSEFNCVIDLQVLESGASAISSISVDGQSSLGAWIQSDSDALLAVARATAEAFEKLKQDSMISVEDVVVYKRWDGQMVALTQVIVELGTKTQKVVGSGCSERGILISTAEAVVDAARSGYKALNRVG